MTHSSRFELEPDIAFDKRPGEGRPDAADMLVDEEMAFPLGGGCAGGVSSAVAGFEIFDDFDTTVVEEVAPIESRCFDLAFAGVAVA